MPTAALPAAAEALSRAGPLWLPGEGARLAERVWAGRPFGLDPDHYASGRWLARDPRVRRRVLGMVTVGDSVAVVEAPDATLAIRCAALGLKMLDTLPAGGETLIAEALALLGAVPGLPGTLGALVRSIHPLRGMGPGYDTSHSDPELPFSIFVSLPLGEPGATLRLAESVLHEAMHLQLTLLEAEGPLVAELEAAGWSPWQRRDRPVGGLLHGLYVFAVIDEVLAGLLAGGTLDSAGTLLAERRRREIAAEAAELPLFENSTVLSPAGRAFTRRLRLAIPAPKDNPASSS